MAQPADTPSEFGGAPGLVQPEPHTLTSVEQARLERQTNPASTSDSVEAARERANGRIAGDPA
jgi:hypothetical protein